MPATLQESLIARLDRLGPSKDLAQLCAVVGRSFDFELIKAASGIDEAGLRKELDRLRDLDILHTIDGPSVETFVFKHALIQDAAYASLVRSRRRELHRHVGETLAAKFSARIEIAARAAGAPLGRGRPRRRRDPVPAVGRQPRVRALGVRRGGAAPETGARR